MIKPGKSITQVYRLKNEADDTVAKISLVPISPAGEQGHFNLQFGGSLPAYFSLLNADLPDFPVTLPLKAGETRELVLKITIPESAEERDYPAALAIEADTQGLIGGSGAVARATLAAPILLAVSQTGTPNRIAKIEEFRVLTGPALDSFDAIEFLLRLKNQSLIRLQPVGQIRIKNIFGRNVATLPVQNDQILGGTVRQLKIAGWNPVFPLGRYTATAEITPLDTANTVSQTISFWVIPYKALIAAGLLLIGGKGLTGFTKRGKLKQ